MIRRFLAPLAALVLATSACSQENHDYESMGTMAVKIDGVAHGLCIPYLPDEDEAHARMTGPVASMQSLLVDAFTCIDGDLDSPRVSLSVFRPRASATGSDLNLFTADGTTYLAGADSGMGTLKVTEVEMSGGHVTLAVEASAVAVELEGLDYLPVTGAEPVAISGTVSVELRQ